MGTEDSRKNRRHLLVSSEEALLSLVPLVDEVVQLRSSASQIPGYKTTEYESLQREVTKWRSCVAALLVQTFSDGEALRDQFLKPVQFTYEPTASDRFETILNELRNRLESYTEPIKRRLLPEAGVSGPPVVTVLTQLARFGDGLSRIRRESKQGADGHRPPYRIVNEYDIQDALWVLIRPQFPDAVDESPTPKTGLSWSRVDIWLPSQSMAIEVKFARSSSDGKRIDGELKKDFADYQAAGAKTVAVLLVEASGVYGLEQLENLGHTIREPRVHIIRVRL